MSADPHVQALLDELLASDATPEQLCASCPQLLPEVRRQWSCLRKVRTELDLLFPSADGVGTSSPAPARQDTSWPQIPGYEVEAVLGRGGASIVYRARHVRLSRQVALKMLLAGAYASPDELERFLREAQAVAGLRHPNIVQLYEAGDVDRRPYFTMELIEGGSLVRKLTGAPQPARAAAALVATVAEAIHFAHQRGIIHRDLTPANILLTADGTPKVSDFGLARRVEVAGITITGVAMGTPSYMAPEQARGEHGGIGPTTDVYALGAILYETLTGRPPFRAESSAATVQQALANDPVPPGRLNPRVPRDLETICLKCLDKQPKGRYASAAALAGDLRRFERGEPITARPVGWLGRLVRFARRRPAVAALSSGLIAATILLIASLMIGVFVANNAREAAQTAREAEAAQRAEAVKQLARSEKANEILLRIFRGVNPRYEERGGPPLLAQLGEQLNHAAQLLEGESVGDPLHVVRMQLDLGRAQLNLGQIPAAMDLFTKARGTLEEKLGPHHPDTLLVIDDLVRACLEDGQVARAVALGEEALTRHRDVLGPDHAATLHSMTTLATACIADEQAARAIALLDTALGKQRALLGPDHPDILATLTHLAAAYSATGKLDRCAALREEVLERTRALHGADHYETLAALNSLAVAYTDNGEPARAIPLLEEALAKNQARLGPDHPSTLATMENLGWAYDVSGQAERALPLFEQVRERYEARFGPDHRNTLEALANLAGGYRSVGRLPESLALYEKVVEQRTSLFGLNDPETLSTKYSLARVFRISGQASRAVQLYEDILERQTARLGPDHPLTLRTLSALGIAYLLDRQLAKAITTLEQALEKERAILNPEHPDTLATMDNLAGAYYASGQAARGIPLLEHVLVVRRARFSPSHPETLLVMANLAVDYQVCGKYAEAEPLLVEWLAEQRSRLPADSVELAPRQKRLGQCRLMLRQYAEAEQPLRDALAAFEKRQSDSVVRYETESLLGSALAGQNREADAEALLVRSATALRDRAGDSSPASRQAAIAAVKRLIDLYDACDRHEDAAQWRKELEHLELPE